MHNGKGKCCVLVNCTYHLFPSCSTRATEEFSGKKENRPFAEKIIRQKEQEVKAEEQVRR